MVQLLSKDSEASKPTHLVPLASRFTLNTISETSMGVKLDAMPEADEYRRRVYGIGDLLLERFLKPWLHDKKLYNLSTLRLQMDKRLKPVHAFTRSVIKTRRQLAVDNLSTQAAVVAQTNDDNM